MKTRLILIYGYVLPYAGSVLVAGLPAVLPFISYQNISTYYQGNIPLLLCLLAVASAVALPFQTKILHEDNPHVLAVLHKGKIRKIFIRASVVQAITILLIALVLTILSSIQEKPVVIGFAELFGSCLIIFESISLISNGLVYGKIRERIIDAANKAIQNRSNTRK